MIQAVTETPAVTETTAFTETTAVAEAPAVTEAQFTERVVRMGVVKPPATVATAMKWLLRQGI